MVNWKTCGIAALFLSAAMFAPIDAPDASAGDLIAMGSPQSPPPPPPGQGSNIGKPFNGPGPQGGSNQGPPPGMTNRPGPQGGPNQVPSHGMGNRPGPGPQGGPNQGPPPGMGDRPPNI